MQKSFEKLAFQQFTITGKLLKLTVLSLIMKFSMYYRILPEFRNNLIFLINENFASKKKKKKGYLKQLISCDRKS